MWRIVGSIAQIHNSEGQQCGYAHRGCVQSPRREQSLRHSTCICRKNSHTSAFLRWREPSQMGFYRFLPHLWRPFFARCKGDRGKGDSPIFADTKIGTAPWCGRQKARGMRARHASRATSPQMNCLVAGEDGVGRVLRSAVLRVRRLTVHHRAEVVEPIHLCRR
jgi:hypothetical protein